QQLSVREIPGMLSNSPARSEGQRHLGSDGMKGDLDFPQGRGDLVGHAGRNHGDGASGELQRGRIFSCELRFGAEKEAGIPARREKNQGLCFRFPQRTLSLAFQSDSRRLQPWHVTEGHEVSANEALAREWAALLARRRNALAGRRGRDVAQEL